MIRFRYSVQGKYLTRVNSNVQGCGLIITFNDIELR
jgi:hypothetical protein